MTTKLLFSIIVFSLSMLPSFSQNVRRDFHLWTSLEFNRKVSKNLDFSCQIQNRMDRNINRLRGNYLSFDASYKLAKGVRMVFDARLATSARWDKYRFGVGFQKTIKLKDKAKSELRFRALYQYQFFPTSDERFGIDAPQQNFRFKATFTQKIFKKTYLILQAEPLWRAESGDFFFRRFRAISSIKRSLPGPWTLQADYISQFNFNERAHFNILSFRLEYTWKDKKKKDKKKKKSNPTN